MAKLAPYVAIFFGLFLAVLAVPDAVETLQVANAMDGYRSTRADVLQHTTKKPERGPEIQVLKFRYTVGERVFDGDNHWTRASDTEEELQALVRKEKNGKKTVLVYYDPDAPRHAVIRKSVPLWFPTGVLLVTSLLLIGGVMSFITQKKRQAMIARNKPTREN